MKSEKEIRDAIDQMRSESAHVEPDSWDKGFTYALLWALGTYDAR